MQMVAVAQFIVRVDRHLVRGGGVLEVAPDRDERGGARPRRLSRGGPRRGGRVIRSGTWGLAAPGEGTRCENGRRDAAPRMPCRGHRHRTLSVTPKRWSSGVSTQAVDERHHIIGPRRLVSRLTTFPPKHCNMPCRYIDVTPTV